MVARKGARSLGAGGEVRDGSGQWCIGFGCNIGVCMAIEAKLWGVYYGLSMAWDNGFRKVILEVDSVMVVN